MNVNWTQDYITNVLPILMRDPLLEILGQTDEAIPYKYEDVVKFSGHSCVSVAGAWIITRKALEALYPDEIPVRGQIRIIAPGGEDQGVTGVLGEVMTFITGAAPRTGFSGSNFGKKYNRRDLIQYQENFTDSKSVNKAWIFERIDNGAKVSVIYNTSKILPLPSKEDGELMPKIGARTASPEQTRNWIKAWNKRAKFVLENADKEGLLTVERLK